jgi:hypothetical protein
MPAVSVEHLAKSILVMLVWAAAGVFVGLRRWDWSPKRG